jgi:hypothetical protein
VRKRTNAARFIAASAINLVFALACVTSASGQVTVAKNLNMTMNGNLGAVYAGSFGNYTASNHNLGLGIDGTLSGYYFRPQFLSFQVRPYYDRAQSNSESQTITSGTGVWSSVSLFGGSHFPGSISYGRAFGSNSEFRIAGVPSILGDSSNSNIGVSWSALFSGLPTLHASYSISDSTSTALGTTEQSRNSSRIFSLNSDYRLGGFSLNGSLNHYNTEVLSPSFLTAEAISSTSSSTGYSLSATHSLPLSGSFGLGWSRAASDNGLDEFTTSSYTASAGFSPWQRLSISQAFSYTTNVMGALAQSLGNPPVSPWVDFNPNSSLLFMNTVGTLSVARGFAVSGYLNHRIMHSQGQDFENTQYGGTVSFQKANNFLGFLRFSIGVVDTASKEGNNGLGLTTSLTMNRKFGRWETTADFNYAQYTQTLLAIATTSNYNYGGSIRRKINDSTYFSASLRQSRSGLTAQRGNSNVSDSFATGLSWTKYSLSTSYSRASGVALLGADGTLTAAPLGSIVSPYSLTIDARSMGIFAGVQLFRVLNVAGGYTKVSSSTIMRASSVFNNGNRFNARLRLRMRRLDILAGFTRGEQESSVIPGGPRAVNSYYVSLSRWFDVF